MIGICAIGMHSLEIFILTWSILLKDIYSNPLLIFILQMSTPPCQEVNSSYHVSARSNMSVRMGANLGIHNIHKGDVLFFSSLYI